MFIVFDGSDGVGKSTQIARVSQALAHQGIDHITTREPGGTPAAEHVRSLLLHEKDHPWPLWAEVFLLAAARAHHVTYTIKPALQRGQWVLCDRFIESTRAYQQQAYQENPVFFDTIMLHASQGLVPDKTFILHMSEALRLTRRPAFGGDCFESRDADFQSSIAAYFATLVDHPPEHYVILNAHDPIDALTQRILEGLGEIKDRVGKK